MTTPHPSARSADVDDGELSLSELIEKFRAFALHAWTERRYVWRSLAVTVPLGVLRTVGRLAGGWKPGRPSVLGPDRLADLSVEGWCCDGGRLAAVTGFRAQRDAAASLGDALRFYRETGWL